MINVAIVEDEQEAVEYLSDCLHRYGEKTGETFSFTHFPEPITFLERNINRFMIWCSWISGCR